MPFTTIRWSTSSSTHSHSGISDQPAVNVHIQSSGCRILLYPLSKQVKNIRSRAALFAINILLSMSWLPWRGFTRQTLTSQLCAGMTLACRLGDTLNVPREVSMRVTHHSPSKH